MSWEAEPIRSSCEKSVEESLFVGGRRQVLQLTTEWSDGGMVTSPHHLASRAGQAVLREGGTAIEAAVAIAAALAVVYPHMTGIGGDAFWLIVDGEGAVVTIDGAGPAGRAVDVDQYSARGLDSIPWRGPLAAITVAGAVASWQEALVINAEWGGTLSLERLLEEAIHLAGTGFAASSSQCEATTSLRTELEPVLNFAQLHLPCAAPPRPGDRYNQPALEGTLRELSRSGLEDFYRGTVARRIASELAQAGSALQLADLAAYSATVRDPLRVRLSDSFVYNLRPPSQGIASLLILGVFERLGIQEADGFEHVHALVEATKQAFIVRDRVVGHRSEEPLEVHLEPQALDRLAGRVDPGRAIPWPSPPSGGDTVWFGVIDAAGRCVSAIQSLYFPFGSGVALPESGFVWQNRGCAFKLHGDGPNVLAPGRKPFHTLNPAFAQFSDGRRMVYGSMGGDGQPQFQAAVFTRYARFRQDLQTAVSAPRWLLGRTWGETRTSLRLERRFGNTLAQALIDAGHDVELIDDYSETMGHAGALVRHADRRIAGASDPRSDGAAFGV